MQYIGCHLSSSKGFAAMGKTALSIGANTFQFFTRNPRGGAAKDIDPQDAQALVLMQGSGEIGKIVAHAPYTLNPCAKEEKTLEFARNTMQDDLRRMEFVPGNFYNFHPGSHVGQGTEEGIRKIAETLDLAMFEGQTTIVLLETMAGKGTEVGGRFEELRAIIDRTAMQEKLGVCLDTCHVSDAGYDIAGHLDAVLEEFDRVIGLAQTSRAASQRQQKPARFAQGPARTARRRLSRHRNILSHYRASGAAGASDDSGDAQRASRLCGGDCAASRV